MEKLVLIDGNSLINRAFYAMPLLTTKNGVFTNAVYGFMNMFIKMMSDDKPDYVAVAFDVHAPTFRHKMYAEYKGTRKPSPAELHPQIELTKKVLKEIGVATIEQAGIEADDIIGTIAKSTNVKTIIYTGDRDSFQLVDSDTEVHFTKRGISDVEILNNDNFYEKMEITPKQVIELKALMGDASDNIPGVLGIGEKTAKQLLKDYGDIDGVYNNVEKLTGKLKEKIENGKDSAYMSKTLATINTTCDIDCDLEKMRFKMPFSLSTKKIFIDLELRSIYNREELFGEKTGEKEDVKVSETKSSVNIIVKESLEDIESIIIDNFFSLVILDDSVNIYSGETEYEYKIKNTLFDEGFSLSNILQGIKPLLTKNYKVLVYSKKDLMHFIFDNANYQTSCNFEDLSLVKYLADYTGGNENLKEIIEYYNQSLKTPAFSIYQIFNDLFGKLKNEEMESLYKNVELPLSDVLYSMEQSGFKVDVNALYNQGKEFAIILQDIEKEIKEIAGDNININSPKQLGELLFEKLKIGKGKKTKTGYSTSAEVLQELEDAHPIIPKILRYRQIQKLQSTYIEGLKPLIDKNTGIIKTSFNQTVTSTGRLSSKEPNLQNIPVRDELGKELRKFFVPKGEDRILITADYSQIELRLLAAFSNCQLLIDAFNSEKDVHTATASMVFNVKESEVTPEMRRKAKAVNFGIIYGISEYGLAKNINVSASVAKDYIASYFNKYKEVKEYMEQNVDFARKTGYAITMLKRRRYIREIHSPNFNLRQFGERAAMNMPLQGSAADVIKLAMINVFNRLKKENLKSELILQIHDELIIDAYISEEEKVKKILIEEMENAVKLSVKLTANMGEGKTWYDAK